MVPLNDCFYGTIRPSQKQRRIVAKPRNIENVGLPTRWRLTHGAYYYSVPPGLEHLWDFKKLYRLGDTFEQALAEFVWKMEHPDTSTDIDQNTLCNKETVVTAAQPFIEAGVYFLLADSDVLYVGRSDRVFFRISQHVERGIIPFDKIHMISATGLEQTRLEQLYIGRFLPKFNIYHAGTDVL